MSGIKGVKVSPNRKYLQRETLCKKFKYRIGETFGKLIIIDIVNVELKSGRSRNLCLCKCECGNEKLLPYYDLTSGRVISCGCYHKEIVSISGTNQTYYDNAHKYSWYFVLNNEKIMCRSSYEVMFANYLINENIDFLYEPKTFKLENGRRYTPDFYLINENLWIELKGDFNMNTKQKDSISFFSQLYNLKLMFWEDIRNYCHLKLKHWNSYMKKAKKASISVEDYFALQKYNE